MRTSVSWKMWQRLSTGHSPGTALIPNVPTIIPSITRAKVSQWSVGGIWTKVCGTCERRAFSISMKNSPSIPTALWWISSMKVRKLSTFWCSFLTTSAQKGCSFTSAIKSFSTSGRIRGSFQSTGAQTLLPRSRKWKIWRSKSIAFPSSTFKLSGSFCNSQKTLLESISKKPGLWVNALFLSKIKFWSLVLKSSCNFLERKITQKKSCNSMLQFYLTTVAIFWMCCERN